VNVFFSKKLLILFENLFFIVLYSIVGSLYLSLFYKESFFLSIGGNGGFIGNYLVDSFISEIVNSNEKIFGLSFIFILILLFLLSINFKLYHLVTIKNFLFKKKSKNETVVNNQNNEIKNKNITASNAKIVCAMHPSRINHNNMCICTLCKSPTPEGEIKRWGKCSF